MKVKLFPGILSHSLIVSGLSPKTMERIHDDCEFRNPVFMSAQEHSAYGYVSYDIPRTLNFALVDNDAILLNRGATTFLPKKRLRKFQLVNWKDKRVFKSVKFPELAVTLSDEQKTCLSALETAIQQRTRRFGNLLFIASTSVGKTIAAIAISKRLGQKTLVLCPTDLIMRAWLADLQKAMKFTSKEIGIIKQKKWEEGKQFTLASIQTLGRRREAWEELNREFGAIIVDEVQGVSAPTLFDFVSQSPAAYLVGVTATAENREGTRNLHLQALFGEPLVEVNTYHKETKSSMPITEVKLVNTHFEYQHQEGNLNWHDLAVKMMCDEDRNQLIIDNVVKEWMDRRTILVVTKRREHVDLLFDMAVENRITNANKLTGDTNADRFYTEQLLKMVDKRQVTLIIATMQAIKTGANIPALDSLHIGMPPANKRDVEQLLGRIRRKADGKKEATLTYYFDKKASYLVHLFYKVFLPVFRKMKIPGYERAYGY